MRTRNIVLSKAINMFSCYYMYMYDTNSFDLLQFVIWKTLLGLKEKGKNIYSSMKPIMLVVHLVINQYKELKFAAMQTVNGCQKAPARLQPQVS